MSEEERDGNDGNESYADDEDYDEGNLVDISEGRRCRLVGSVGRLLSRCEVVEGDLVKWSSLLSPTHHHHHQCHCHHLSMGTWSL